MRSRALNLAALALLTGLCGSTGVALRPAAAQQLDANKPPAQIFAGTCAACHRSPRGLVRSVAPGSLPSFLRQHYTTGNDMAGTMASFVLGNGGTQQVAEPPAKQEPKQRERAKSDGQDVAARTPAADPAAQSKSAKQQKAGKKGQVQPAAPPAPEPEKPEVVAKPETSPPAEPAKPETAAADCKIESAKQAEDGTPPRQPAALLTLPGFPAPEPEPEAEPATQPGCEPAAPVTTAAHADTQAAEPAKEKEQAKEQPEAPAAPPAPAETPKNEPLRATVTEAPLRATVTETPLRASATETPSLDIMREEVHAPRVVRSGQKKRAPPQ
jgi:hypothetical protein